MDHSNGGATLAGEDSCRVGAKNIVYRAYTMFLSTFSGEDSYNGLRRLFVCVLFSRAEENMEEAVALHYMSVNYYYLLHLYGYQVQSNMNKRRRSRWWMTTIHRNRTITGMERLLSELTAESGIEFPGFLRMSTSDFEILLQKLAPLITKKDTKFRKAIPAKVRLAITLRYLATGDDFRSLHYLFKISHQLISKIVHEVCASILIVLKDEVMVRKIQYFTHSSVYFTKCL
ncbi:unnamed protein product [Acanthoscelides obtectus]|uniref:Uncharacterized protein n=1 Tax=Acanthoscelides obtectus TaxID=200917 RepID=A0A9P0JMP1_ACAOB|nr:unnamed protein product [Acanthoscelides obtectus]CAK1641388.1 hypothetical protein AOBTE_LOCUS12376 [Acanthoscelides obtectus]